MTPDFIRYANQGATRNQPLSPQMYDALGFLGDLGVQMEVFSGGQPAKGSGKPRVGSVRHDHGNSADVFFYRDGERLDWRNPEHIPIYQEIVRRGREAGLTGFGAGEGYMQPGSMHIGFGTPAVWGAGGSGANAPKWLREAYYGDGGAPTQPNVPRNPNSPEVIAADAMSALGVSPHSGHNHGGTQVAGAGGTSGLIGSGGQDSMDDGLLGSGRPQSFSAGLREAAKSGALWENLATAFNSLRHKPDPQLAQMMAGRAARRDDMQSRNRTAEWLRSQGMGKYADAIEAGGMTAAQAMQLAQREQEMAMAAARGPEATAMQRNYEFLIAQGMSPEQALEAVRGGTSVNVNTGTSGRTALEQLPSPPDDMMWATDADNNPIYETLTVNGQEVRRPVPVPLPGTKAEEQARANESAAVGAVESARTMLETIEGIESHPALDTATGKLSWMQSVPDTPQYDFGTRIEQLQGQSFLQAYERLRGGGQITEVEGKKAEAAISRLRSGLSPEDYRAALGELRGVVERGLARAEGRAVGNRLRYNPETGEFE